MHKHFSKYSANIIKNNKVKEYFYESTGYTEYNYKKEYDCTLSFYYQEIGFNAMYYKNKFLNSKNALSLGFEWKIFTYYFSMKYNTEDYLFDGPIDVFTAVLYLKLDIDDIFVSYSLNVDINAMQLLIGMKI